MNLFDYSKSIIENIYFVSGPLLGILGFFIFRQIKLAKNQLLISQKQLEESQNQIRINSLREAATLSADLTKEYIDNIIPMINQLNEVKKELKFIDLDYDIKNFTNDEFKDNCKNLNAAMKNRPDRMTTLELDIINKLEWFSIYFTKGIADENIAFTSIGKEFCKTVELEYPIITILRGSKNPNKSYDNLVELYNCWNTRIKTSLMNFEKEEISKELQEKIKKLEKLNSEEQNVNSFKPIGT
nr:hypothetical protein [uncultured Flavobacterium sp.]